MMAYLIPAILLVCTLWAFIRIYQQYRILFWMHAINISAFSLLIQYNNMRVSIKRCVHHAKSECNLSTSISEWKRNGRTKKNSKSIFISIRIYNTQKMCARRSICVCVCVFVAVSLLYGTNRGMKIVDRALLSILISGVRRLQYILSLSLWIA